MASIREKKQDGKTVSYQFSVVWDVMLEGHRSDVMPRGFRHRT